MSLFRRLFGLESTPPHSPSLGSPPVAERSSATLLKHATRLKEERRYEDAIVILKQAFDEIAREGGGHSISTYLRLPMMLQLAGQRDAAWAEYNRLLTANVTGMSFDKNVGPMEHSQIYDKMRVMLHREGNWRWAVSMGILSHASWAVGLKHQRRQKEFAEHVSASTVTAVLTPLLRKANAEAALEQLVTLVTSTLSQPERLDFGLLVREINAIIPRERSPSGK